MSKFTNYKFEFTTDSHTGVTMSWNLPVRLEGQHPAAHVSLDNLALVSKDIEVLSGVVARTMTEIIREGMNPENVYIKAISIDADPHSLRKFDIRLINGDAFDIGFGTYAPDHAHASLLAAMKQSLVGKKLDAITVSHETLLDTLTTGLEETDQVLIEAKRAEFEVADWRIADEASEDLTEAQKQPFKLSLLSGGYGPVAQFERDGETYDVQMEIDRGCVVVRTGPSRIDEPFVSVRLSRDAAQVELQAGSGQSLSFMISDIIERNDSQLLEQDSEALPALKM